MPSRPDGTPGVARIGDFVSADCPWGNPVDTIIEGAIDTFVNDIGTVREGDDTDNDTFINEGSTCVFVNDKPLARKYDRATMAFPDEGLIWGGGLTIFGLAAMSVLEMASLRIEGCYAYVGWINPEVSPDTFAGCEINGPPECYDFCDSSSSSSGGSSSSSSSSSGDGSSSSSSSSSSPSSSSSSSSSPSSSSSSSSSYAACPPASLDCCNDGTNCSHCPDLTPAKYTVTFTDVDLCDCVEIAGWYYTTTWLSGNAINGTFELTQSSPCIWEYTTPTDVMNINLHSTSCGNETGDIDDRNDSMTIKLERTTTQWILTVTNTAIDTYIFRDVQSAGDCGGLLPQFINDFGCGDTTWQSTGDGGYACVECGPCTTSSSSSSSSSSSDECPPVDYVGCDDGTPCSNCSDMTPGKYTVVISDTNICDGCFDGGFVDYSLEYINSFVLNGEHELVQDTACEWSVTYTNVLRANAYTLGGSCDVLNLLGSTDYNLTITLTRTSSTWELLVSDGSNWNMFYATPTQTGAGICESLPKFTSTNATCGQTATGGAIGATGGTACVYPGPCEPCVDCDPTGAGTTPESAGITGAANNSECADANTTVTYNTFNDTTDYCEWVYNTSSGQSGTINNLLVRRYKNAATWNQGACSLSMGANEWAVFLSISDSFDAQYNYLEKSTDFVCSISSGKMSGTITFTDTCSDDGATNCSTTPTVTIDPL